MKILRILIPFSLLLLACGASQLGVAKKDVAAGNYESAITALQAEISKNPANGEAMLLLAECYEKTERADSAMAMYQRVLATDASNSTATASLSRLYIARGSAAREAGSLRLALENYENAEELTPQAFDVFYERGIAYQKFNLLEKANAEFEQAAQISPNDPRVKTQLGELASQTEQADKYFQEGFALFQKKRWNQAVKSLEQAVALDASHKDAKYALHMARGHVLYKRGSVSDLWDAITEFGYAGALRSESAEPVYFMAQAYEKKDRDDYKLSVETYEKVLELEPNSDFAQKAKKRIKYLLDRKEKMEKFWGKKKN